MSNLDVCINRTQIKRIRHGFLFIIEKISLIILNLNPCPIRKIRVLSLASKPYDKIQNILRKPAKPFPQYRNGGWQYPVR